MSMFNTLWAILNLSIKVKFNTVNMSKIIGVDKTMFVSRYMYIYNTHMYYKLQLV